MAEQMKLHTLTNFGATDITKGNVPSVSSYRAPAADNSEVFAPKADAASSTETPKVNIDIPKVETTTTNKVSVADGVKRTNPVTVKKDTTTSTAEGSGNIQFNGKLKRDSDNDVIYAPGDPITAIGLTAENVGAGALDAVDKAMSAPQMIKSGYYDYKASKATNAADKAKYERESKLAYEEATKSIYGEGSAIDEFIKDTSKYSSELGEAGQFFTGLGRSGGEMLPSILAGNALGAYMGAAGFGEKAISTATQVASYGTMFGRVYSGEVENMVEAGYDMATAQKKGLISGAIEVGTEMLTGGIPGAQGSVGEGLLDTGYTKFVNAMADASAIPFNSLTQNTAQQLGLQFAKSTAGVWNFLAKTKAGSMVADLMGEGVEEWISEVVTPYTDRAIGLDTPNATAGEQFTAFLGGVLLSAFMEAGNISSSIKYNNLTNDSLTGKVSSDNTGLVVTSKDGKRTTHLSWDEVFNLARNSEMEDEFGSLKAGYEVDNKGKTLDQAYAKYDRARTAAEKKAANAAAAEETPKSDTLLSKIKAKFAEIKSQNTEANSDSAAQTKIDNAEQVMTQNASQDTTGMTEAQKSTYAKVMMMNLGVTVGFNQEVYDAIGIGEDQRSSVSLLLPEFWPEELLVWNPNMTDADVTKYYEDVVKPAIDVVIESAANGKVQEAKAKKTVNNSDLASTVNITSIPLGTRISRDMFTKEAVKAYKESHEKFKNAKTSTIKQAMADEIAEFAKTNPTQEAWDAKLNGIIDKEKYVRDVINAGKGNEIFGETFTKHYQENEQKSAAKKVSDRIPVFITGSDGKNHYVTFEQLVEQNTGKPFAEATEKDIAVASMVYNKILEADKENTRELIDEFAPQLEKLGLTADLMSDKEIADNPNKYAVVDHDKGQIRYNPTKIRTKAAAIVTTVHEMLHVAQRKGKAKELSARVKAMASKLGYDYDAVYDDISKNKAYKDKGEEVWRMETDAKFLGTILGTKEGVEALSVADPDALLDLVGFIENAIDPLATDPITKNQREVVAEAKENINGTAQVKAKMAEDAKERAAEVESNNTQRPVNASGRQAPLFTEPFKLSGTGIPLLDKYYSIRYDSLNGDLYAFKSTDGPILKADGSKAYITKKMKRAIEEAFGMTAKWTVLSDGQNLYDFVIEGDPVKARATYLELARRSGVDVNTLGLDAALNQAVAEEYTKDRIANSGENTVSYQPDPGDYYTDASGRKYLGLDSYRNSVENLYGKEIADKWVEQYRKDCSVPGGSNMEKSLTKVLDDNKIGYQRYYTDGTPVEYKTIQTTDTVKMVSKDYPVLNGLNMKLDYTGKFLRVSTPGKRSFTTAEYNALRQLGFKGATSVVTDAEGDAKIDLDGKKSRSGYSNIMTLYKDAEQTWYKFGGYDLSSGKLNSRKVISNKKKGAKVAPLIRSPKARMELRREEQFYNNINDSIMSVPYPVSYSEETITKADGTTEKKVTPGFGKGLTITRVIDVETPTGEPFSGLILQADHNLGSFELQQLYKQGWHWKTVRVPGAADMSSVLTNKYTSDTWNALRSGNAEAFAPVELSKNQVYDTLDKLKWHPFQLVGDGKQVSMAVYDGEIVLRVDAGDADKATIKRIYSELYRVGFTTVDGKRKGGFKNNDALFPNSGVKLFHQPFDSQIWYQAGGEEGMSYDELNKLNYPDIDDVFAKDTEGAYDKDTTVYVEEAPFGSPKSYVGPATLGEGGKIYKLGTETEIKEGARVTYPRHRGSNGEFVPVTAIYYSPKQTATEEAFSPKKKKKSETAKTTVQAEAETKGDYIVITGKGSRYLTADEFYDHFIDYVGRPGVIEIRDLSDNSILYANPKGYDEIIVKYKDAPEVVTLDASYLADYRYRDDEAGEYKLDPSVEYIMYKGAPEGEYLANANTGVFTLDEILETPKEVAKKETIYDPLEGIEDDIKKAKEAQKKRDAEYAELIKDLPKKGATVFPVTDCQGSPELNNGVLRYSPADETIEYITIGESADALEKRIAKAVKNTSKENREAKAAELRMQAVEAAKLSKEAQTWLKAKGFTQVSETTWSMRYKGGIFRAFGMPDYVHDAADLAERNRRRASRGELRPKVGKDGRISTDAFGNVMYEETGSVPKYTDLLDTSEAGIANYRDSHKAETRRLSDQQVAALMTGKYDAIMAKLNEARNTSDVSVDPAKKIKLDSKVDDIFTQKEDGTKPIAKVKRAEDADLSSPSFALYSKISQIFEKKGRGFSAEGTKLIPELKEIFGIDKDASNAEVRRILTQYIRGFESEYKAASPEQRTNTLFDLNRYADNTIIEGSEGTSLADTSGKLIFGESAEALKESDGGKDADGRVLIFKNLDTPETVVGAWGPGVYLSTADPGIPGDVTEWYAAPHKTLYMSGEQTTMLADNSLTADEKLDIVEATAKRLGYKISDSTRASIADGDLSDTQSIVLAISNDNTAYNPTSLSEWKGKSREEVVDTLSAQKAQPGNTDALAKSIDRALNSANDRVRNADADNIINTIETTAKKLGLKGQIPMELEAGMRRGEVKVLWPVLQIAADSYAKTASKLVNKDYKVPLTKSTIAQAFASALGFDSVRIRTVGDVPIQKLGFDFESVNTDAFNTQIAAIARMDQHTRDYLAGKIEPLYANERTYTDRIVVFGKDALIARGNSNSHGTDVDAYAYSDEDIRRAWAEAENAVAESGFSDEPITGWLANIPEGNNELMNKLPPSLLQPAGSKNWTEEQWGDYWESLVERGILPNCTEAVWFSDEGDNLNQYRNDADRNDRLMFLADFQNGDVDFEGNLTEAGYERLQDEYMNPSLREEYTLDFLVEDRIDDMKAMEEYRNVPYDYQEGSYVAYNAPFQQPVRLNAKWQKLANRAHPIWKDSYGRLKLLAHGTDNAGFNSFRQQNNGSFSSTDWLYAQAYYGYDPYISGDDQFSYAHAAPEYIPQDAEDFASAPESIRLKAKNGKRIDNDGWYKVALPTSNPMILDGKNSYWYALPLNTLFGPDAIAKRTSVALEDYNDAVIDLIDVADDNYNITNAENRPISYSISKKKTDGSKSIYTVNFEVADSAMDEYTEDSLDPLVACATEIFYNIDNAIELLSGDTLSVLVNQGNALNQLGVTTATVRDKFSIITPGNRIFEVIDSGQIDLGNEPVFPIKDGKGSFRVDIVVDDSIEANDGIVGRTSISDIINLAIDPQMVNLLDGLNAQYANRATDRAKTGNLVSISHELEYDGSVYAFDIGSSTDGDERTHTEAIGDANQYESIYAEDPHPGQGNLMDFAVSADDVAKMWAEAEANGEIKGRQSKDYSKKNPNRKKTDSRISQTLEKMIQQEVPTPEMTEKFEQAIEEIDFGMFEIIHNNKVAAKADKWYKSFKDVDGAFEYWSAQKDSSEYTSFEGQAKTLAVFDGLTEAHKAAVAAGDTQRSEDTMKAILEVLSHYFAVNNSAAKIVQGAKLLNLMTKSPASVLSYAEKWVNATKAAIERKHGKVKDVVEYEIPDTIRRELLDSDEEVRAKGLMDLATDVALVTPKSILDRINGLRNFAMLSAFPTHIRNVGANVANTINAISKDRIAGALEDASADKLDERYYSMKQSHKATASEEVRLDWSNTDKFFHDRAQSEYILKRALANGTKYFDEHSSLSKKVTADLDQAYHRKLSSFNTSTKLGRSLDKASSFVYDMLESEDLYGAGAFRRLFGKEVKSRFGGWLYNYEYAAKQMARANGWTTEFLNKSTDKADPDYAEACKALSAIDEFAIKEADRVTFHTASKLASKLNEIKNMNAGTNIVGNALIPYTKTPINVAKAAVQYSPLALVGAMYQAADISRRGTDENGNSYSTYTLNSAIDRAAGGLHGTALFILGALLGLAGFLSGGDDDENERYQDYAESQLGWDTYSIILAGLGAFTLDWLTPTAMVLFAGVAVADQIKKLNTEGGDTLSATDALDALLNLLEPMTEMSFMTSLSSWATNVSYDGLVRGTLNAVTGNYISQFAPTIAGKIENVFDPTVRSTYAPKNSSIGSSTERALRKVANKSPFAGVNAPSYDVWGNKQTTFPGAGETVAGTLGNAAYQLLSPGYFTQDKTTEADELIEEVFAESNNKKVIPQKFSTSFSIDNQNYYYSNKEYSYASNVGGTARRNAVESLEESDLYDELDTDGKAEVLSNINTYAENVAKDSLMQSRGIEYAVNEKTGKIKNSGKAELDKVQQAVDTGLSVGEYFVIKYMLSDDVAGTKDYQKSLVASRLGLSYAQRKIFNL